MTVSDKMIEMSEEEYLEHNEDGNSPWSQKMRTREQVAQAVVNAAWHKFDSEDESTWPKTKFAPSGHPWLCNRPFEPVLLFFQKKNVHGWKTITSYADPQDLMYKWKDKE